MIGLLSPLTLFAEEALLAGPGKEILYKKCRACHTADRLFMKKHSPDEWKEILERMIGYGVRLNKKDKETLINYLVIHSGATQKK
jgi:hypothetical protein